MQNSSVVKGETIEDTIMMIEQYSDAIVIRHPQVGTAEELELNVRVDGSKNKRAMIFPERIFNNFFVGVFLIFITRRNNNSIDF